MANFKRTNKPTPESQKHGLGRTTKYHGMFIGFVKDNTDAHHMGRLKIWVPEFGSDEKEKEGWITASYCSPFAGITDGTHLGEGSDKVEEFNFAQQSYGMWFVPPDLNNQVAIMFANGDPARAYWFGSIYNQFMNQMVPGVAAARNYEFDDPVPTTEYNKNETKSIDPNDPDRPYHRYHTEGLVKQGLAKDTIRGVTTSSARREAPSHVYGWNTPGPVDPDRTGHRKGGSQMVYDDMDGSEHIAFKTRSGAGIRIDETNGIIYITNRDATGWVEISESGQIQIYGKGDVSVRSEGDINLRADRDLNMEAGRDIKMKAAQSYQAPSDAVKSAEILGDDEGEGGNIYMHALTNIDVTAKENVKMNAESGTNNVNISGDYNLTVGGSYNVNVGADHVESAGSSRGINSPNFQVSDGGDIGNLGNIASIGTHYAADFKSPSHGLNSHQHLYSAPKHPVGPAPTSTLGGGGGSSSVSGPTAATAEISTLPATNEKTNVLYDGDVLTFDKETQSIQTVVSKLMTAEPCRDHENNGGQEL